MTVFSVMPERAFADELARGLLARWDGSPFALSSAMILLPTRRACRSLQDAFLRNSGGTSLLLPSMIPLGDLDEEELIIAGERLLGEASGDPLPPVISRLRRQLLLSHPIKKWAKARSESLPDDQALRLAGELGRFLDQSETEGLSLCALKNLVPESYAEHWQLTLHFLEILTAAWPEIQREKGGIGPAERRRLLLEAQARHWRAHPPHHPVIVAGSTGSIPAVADLMGVVETLPKGEILLPGLDFEASPETWQAIQADPSHPQYGLARLLQRLDLERDDVKLWVPEGQGLFQDKSHRGREKLIHMALRPAASTREWESFVEATPTADFVKALAAVERIDCPTLADEALTIALILRQVLEDADKTGVLITPDRQLARRVARELQRWDLTIDDSAGTALSETSAAVYLRLTAEMVAADFAPVPLLAALKHPLSSAGLPRGRFLRLVRLLERLVLRGGLRPARGLAGLRDALRLRFNQTENAKETVHKAGGARAPGRENQGRKEDQAALLALLTRLEDQSQAFRHLLGQQDESDLVPLAMAHVAFAEDLAQSQAPKPPPKKEATPEEPQPIEGAERLWQGDEGRALADFAADIFEAQAEAPVIDCRHYPQVLAALMAGRVVRRCYGTHPRLAILGTIEARMQSADVVVLGGLNEGSWPGRAAVDPWMSQPMRKDFGLPLNEQSIGLMAQDFLQAFSAGRLYLTRAEKVEGAPTTPSRWLLRLDALLQGRGCPFLLDGQTKENPAPWLAWAQALDQPKERLAIKPPAPAPPVAARPRRLSATRIEQWRRDPYGLYANKILHLRKLDPLDEDPSAADKGNLIHKALELFVRRFPDALPDDSYRELLEIARPLFAPFADHPAIWLFWWQRFEKAAQWFVQEERARRGEIAESLVEITGDITFEAPGGPFTLEARADRLCRMAYGGNLLIDYKTGEIPKVWVVQSGLSPQLPLEASILQQGGFRDGQGRILQGDEKTALEYWQLSGAGAGGRSRSATGEQDPSPLIEEAWEGLKALVASYDDACVPYHAVPDPANAPSYNDYKHLERLLEWSGEASEE